MELIRINENKLKIMLSEGDMKQYAIDCASLDYDNTETRRAFWSILDEAKHQTGFDAASQRVFVQLYPSKEGGCEMFVTKLGSPPLPVEPSESPEPMEFAPLGCHCLTPLRHTDILYAFPSLEVLLSVCRRLNTLGFSEPCSAWKRDDGQYLLLLSEREENLYIPLSELTFLCEYGTKENAESALLLLEEHGTCLCRKNTVAAFARL